jgi:hypothetical protein
LAPCGTVKISSAVQKPKDVLNKVYLRQKPTRAEFDQFKISFKYLLDQVQDDESEEFHKNLISDFLKNTFYSPNHFINTKGRNDLVIHNSKRSDSSVGVIIEAKKPTNKTEMLGVDNINCKGLHELILYYLRERVSAGNVEIKNLIATNISEWFIFNAATFEKQFACNKKLVRQFIDFEAGRLSGTTTDFFYNEIARPFVENLDEPVSFAHFKTDDLRQKLSSEKESDEKKLIPVFKLLKPTHLLKLPFVNDSNTLDKRFYSELLHVIGLEETKKGTRKLIGRKPESRRDPGSILENTIGQLRDLDKLSRIRDLSQFGDDKETQLFGVALSLVITWIDRLLFLKLLEAQLRNYHDDGGRHSFLNSKCIHNLDDLNSLYFGVLAKKFHERDKDLQERFGSLPYLNSSLFEPTELEHDCIFVSNLRDDLALTIFTGSVLKDEKGRKKKGTLNTLQYIFEFLDAYDFGGESGGLIQEENKTLISATVLGLIFEKINGYKDGAYFTPGLITMYMCRESIRNTVVHVFNTRKGWDCKTVDGLYGKIDDKDEANQIIDSLRICDPAVGSGHFLVSALNEIIAIKSELKILCDRNGEPPRLSRRLHFLRGWSYEQENEIFPGNTGAGGTAGIRAGIEA